MGHVVRVGLTVLIASANTRPVFIRFRWPKNSIWCQLKYFQSMPVSSMSQEAKEAAPEMTAEIGKGIQSAKEKARAAKKKTTETVSETTEKVKRKLKGEE